MELREVVAEISDRTGRQLRLVGSLGGTGIGAWEIVDAAGTREVLKFSDHPGFRTQALRVMTVSRHLRAAGYPASAVSDYGVLADGTAYYLQRFIPGRRMQANDSEPLSAEDLEVLIGLVRAGEGLAPSVDQDWSLYLPAMLFGGSHEWAVLAQMDHEGVEGILYRARELLDALGPAPLDDRDFVAGDFGPHNVLVGEAGVAAVIDLDASGKGDRITDLARLLRHDQYGEIRRRVYSEATAIGRLVQLHLAEIFWVLTALHGSMLSDHSPDQALAQSHRRLQAIESEV